MTTKNYEKINELASLLHEHQHEMFRLTGKLFLGTGRQVTLGGRQIGVFASSVLVTNMGYTDSRVTLKFVDIKEDMLIPGASTLYKTDARYKILSTEESRDFGKNTYSIARLAHEVGGLALTRTERHFDGLVVGIPSSEEVDFLNDFVRDPDNMVAYGDPDSMQSPESHLRLTMFGIQS